MISKKSRKVQAFMVMEVMEKALEMEKGGADVVHLEVGEPDFETPECIKKAAIRALKSGKTQYTHSLGLIELRTTIAEHYRERYGVSVDPDQIMVTSGTSPALLLICLALLNSGDEVVMSNPHYACYPNFVLVADGVPRLVKVHEEEGFQYRPGMVANKVSKKTKAILINSPSNPAGSLLSFERMKDIARLGAYLISDEIYHGLVYAGREHSALEVTDRAFVINGFSKLYAMTGWRLGYVIAPKRFIRCMQKLHQNYFISANAFVQWAGISAIRSAGEDVARMKRIFNTRRKYIVRRLKELGFGIAVEPTGAFYVLANAKRFSKDSRWLAFDILRDARVGVAPGIDFGSNAEGYLRFSYANSLPRIREGMRRIEAYLRSRRWK